MSNQSTDEVREEIEYQTINEFLESVPPNQLINISDLAEVTHWQAGRFSYTMRTPEIQLHCDNDQCNGIRFFRCVSGKDKSITTDDYTFFYVKYRCSNCQITHKTFSLAVKITVKGEKKNECYKFGATTNLWPPVSPKLIKLIGPDRTEFLKGRRCENQGLGVGAFIYYRRVVENQKNRILSEIIKVCEKDRS